jgi:PilZ domain
MVGWYSSKPKKYAPRRSNPRKQTHVPAVIRSVNGAEIVCTCLVVDVSAGGARLRLDWPGLIPDNVMLVLSSNGLAHRRCGPASLARALHANDTVARRHSLPIAACQMLVD